MRVNVLVSLRIQTLATKLGKVKDITAPMVNALVMKLGMPPGPTSKAQKISWVVEDYLKG